MKIRTFAASILLGATALAPPALAQRSIAKPGNYSDVSAIKILPSQFENYIDFLKR